MNYPKEAWYDERQAKLVYGNVYKFPYVGGSRYVVADDVIYSSLYGPRLVGYAVEEEKVKDWLNNEYGKSYQPTPQEIAEAVQDSIDCAEGNI